LEEALEELIKGTYGGNPLEESIMGGGYI